jgi:hypothetical protein
VAHNASSTKVAQKPAGKSDGKPQQVAEGPGGQAAEATPAAAPAASGGFDNRWSAGIDQNAQ